MRGATAHSSTAFLRRNISIHAPMRGATTPDPGIGVIWNFNPRPHAGSDPFQSVFSEHVESISIHAPHAGSDDGSNLLNGTTANISIHAPHAGSDGTKEESAIDPFNFNPRSPCGERRNSDFSMCCGARFGGFQSTLPMRGATAKTTNNQCHC